MRSVLAAGMLLMAFVASGDAAAFECEMVRGGLKVCTGNVGVGFHIVTSDRRGNVLRYELRFPGKESSEDLLINLVPFAILLPNMKADDRGALMMRILGTAGTDREVNAGGYRWWTKKDGATICVVADKSR